METSQAILATGQRFLSRVLMLVGAAFVWLLLSCSSAHADGLGGTLGAVTTTVAGTSDPAQPVTQPVTTPVTTTVEKVVATVPEVAAPVTKTAEKAVAPVTRTVAPVTQPVQKAVAPVAQQAAPDVRTVTKTVAPVTATVKKVLVPVTRAVAPVTRTVEQNAAPVTHALAPPVAAAAGATAPVLQLLDRTGVVHELAVARSLLSGTTTTATLALDRFSHRSVPTTLAAASAPVVAAGDLVRGVLQRVATLSQHGFTGLGGASLPFDLPGSPAPATPALSLSSAALFALVGLLFLVLFLGGVSPLGARGVLAPVAGPAYPPGTSPG